MLVTGMKYDDDENNLTTIIDNFNIKADIRKKGIRFRSMVQNRIALKWKKMYCRTALSVVT